MAFEEGKGVEDGNTLEDYKIAIVKVCGIILVIL